MRVHSCTCTSTPPPASRVVQSRSGALAPPPPPRCSASHPSALGSLPAAVCTVLPTMQTTAGCMHMAATAAEHMSKDCCRRSAFLRPVCPTFDPCSWLVRYACTCAAATPPSQHCMQRTRMHATFTCSWSWHPQATSTRCSCPCQCLR